MQGTAKFAAGAEAEGVRVKGLGFRLHVFGCRGGTYGGG